MDGNFSIEADYGTYDLKITYLGYDALSYRIKLDKPSVTAPVKLIVTELQEVTIVADIARDRKTPVAYTNVDTKRLQEDLGTQDLVMALNATPGVYATNKGGGDGDAQITIRGFDQNNVATLIDGIPVNDMENGAVYWSNWFGLDAITRTMQVQRGLGASKLAIPSVGGTINIITQGIKERSELSIKQEFANNNFFRTSVAFNSGKLKGGWGVSLAGSFKKNDGWVDGNDFQGGFYYAKVEKMFKEGKHMISASAFGAPQQHGQRFSQQPIAVYDKDYAGALGVPVDSAYTSLFKNINRGYRFNPTWGQLTRTTTTRDENGQILDTLYTGDTSVYNTSRNIYQKPQVMIRYSYAPNERFFLSTSVYASIGIGGGTQVIGANSNFYDIQTGQLRLQDSYNSNVFSKSGEAKTAIRQSVNNHRWFGGLMTFNYKGRKGFTYAGGVDVRSYRGEHYRKLYDMLGGNFYIVTTNADRNGQRRDTIGLGDKMDRNDIGYVNWGGIFGQVEYSNKIVSTFLNVSAAVSAYNKTDYFAKKSLVVDGDMVAFKALGYSDSIQYNGKTYYNNSPEAKFSKTAWKYIPGFTIKGGINFAINGQNNIFLNGGYLNKVPAYNFVVLSNDVKFANNIKNEQVGAFELGYNYTSRYFALNFNGYVTNWINKPVSSSVTYTDTAVGSPTSGEQVSETVYIPGIKALHMGAELDFAIKPNDMFQFEGVIAYGDWTWQSKVQFDWTFENGAKKQFNFDPRGVHVGGSAQAQLSGMVRIEPVKGFYIKPRITYFAKQYADFNPETLSGDNARRESWKLPNYYTLDISAGYSYTFKKKFVLTFRANFINITDNLYIQDANNNAFGDSKFSTFDAKAATVFFGQGFRWSTGVEFSWINIFKKDSKDKKQF